MTQDRYANSPSERNDRTEVLGSDRHLRRDARSVAQMLSLGVVDEERVNTIIRKAYDLLDENSSKGSERQFVALMKVVIAAAKLEQSNQPKEHVHDHTHAAVLTDEQRATLVEVRELHAELERRGLIVDGSVVPKVVEVHSASTNGQATRIPGS